MPTALQYLRIVHNFGAGGFYSIDMPGRPASNSELARWIKQGMLHINERPVKVGDWIDLDNTQSVILFPKNRRRTTLI